LAEARTAPAIRQQCGRLRRRLESVRLGAGFFTYGKRRHRREPRAASRQSVGGRFHLHELRRYLSLADGDDGQAPGRIRRQSGFAAGVLHRRSRARHARSAGELRGALSRRSEALVFLTGQRGQILKLVQDGFHLAVAALPGASEPDGTIAHSPRFVLIDRQARIRGYYDSRELEAFVRLKNDIETLTKG